MISSSRIPRFWLWLCVLGALALAVPVTRWAQQRRQPQRDVRGVRVKLVNALPAQSKRWALVIGVDQYRDSRITPLKGAANDAKLLAEALTNYAGFPAAQVFVLTTNQDADHQPTRANVLEYLYKLRDSVPPDGLLLLSFAGHGLERNRQAFLIPADAGFRDDLTYLREVAVSVTTVREIIRDANVAQKIILLDHCRSDPAASRAEAPNLLTLPWKNAFNFQVVNQGVDAFFTLYATGIGQRAYESSETRQGYFTQAVVEALSGAVANDKGEVTLGALLRYVQDEVPKRVQRALGKNTLQQPHEETVGYRVNDLVIAAVTPKPAAVATVKEPERPAIDPQLLELENRRSENAFWESIKDSKETADFEDYLQRYPKGQFAGLATRKMEALKRAVEEAKRKPESSPVPGKPTKVGAGNITLSPYEFETVRVNERGQVVQRKKEQAWFYVEELGGGVGLEMVEIPGGKFRMGVEPNVVPQLQKEYERYFKGQMAGSGRVKASVQMVEHQRPIHEVAVKSFYFGKFEVTNAQWRAIAALPKVSRDLPLVWDHYGTGDFPVGHVTWHDAVEFCERLSKLTGRKYRLPTEAEWEYSCRAGTSSPFYFGDSITPSLANYFSNNPYGGTPKNTPRAKPIEVGSLQSPNGYGLYDMHGNQWEWCLDIWHPDYKGAPEDGSEWSQYGDQSFRVIRGGSWMNPAISCMSTHRDTADVRTSFAHLGFRVVVAP